MDLRTALQVADAGIMITVVTILNKVGLPTLRHVTRDAVLGRHGLLDEGISYTERTS